MKIKVGDKVNVYFNSLTALFDLTVSHIPQATGDSWILVSEYKDIYYVQIFAYMEKLNCED